MDNQSPIDIAVLENYASSPEDVAFFAGVFLRQTGEDIVSLRAAADSGAQRWIDVCHKIKGAAGMAGAHIMTALCHEGEKMSQNPAAEREAFCTRMEQALEDVRDAFTALAQPRTQSGAQR